MTFAEPHIWRTAKLMIDRFGDDASTCAEMNSGNFLEVGDLDGAKLWARIVEAVEELQRVEPEDGETQH